MAWYARRPKTLHTDAPLPENKEPGSLPATLRQRDLALFTILVIVIVTNFHGLQFAGPTVFFYCFLAFFTLLLPTICVCSWLLRHAPARVPVYGWIVRFLNDRWRPLLLFLRWWLGILGILTALGACLDLLQRGLPQWFSAFPLRVLAFIGLLILSTLIACLPMRLFKRIIWACGLCYLAFFGIVGLATMRDLSQVDTTHAHTTIDISLHALSAGVPTRFSWSFFGLALFALFGLNFTLFLDGEMRGPERFLRHSTSFLWWGGLGTFAALLMSSLAWVVIEPEKHSFLFQLVTPVLGSRATTLAWVLQFLGGFGIVLVYVLIVSRIFLLAVHMKYFPRSLAQLNHFGTPVRAFLFQFVIIACTAVLLLFITSPSSLHMFFPAQQFGTLATSEQSGLLDSITSSLAAVLSALIFVFAFWWLLKRRQRLRGWWARLLLPGLCILGCLASLVCAFSPLTPSWYALFLANKLSLTLAWAGTIGSILLAWVFSELPRRSALVREKTGHLRREKVLRQELQGVYTREQTLHNQLQNTYHEQQRLLDEVNRLYQEQARAAITDPITGLLNHRAFVQCLDEELVQAQHKLHSFLLIFLDLDHFKVVNDTWGHLAGDAVLAGVAQRLREMLRPGDIVGRYGGEEFVLILTDATIADAPERAESLRQALQAASYSWQHAGDAKVEIVVTASIGVAAYGVHGTQREELINKADQAMYRAKLAGRNCVRMANHGSELVSKPSMSSHSHTMTLSPRKPVENLTPAAAQTLQALAAVIQARDDITSTHSARLSGLAEQTGRRLGVSSEDLFLMRLGGLVHDIGKIGIPDAILNKASPLNEGEWAIMQQHTVIGARILEGMGGIFQQLAQVVLAHHERWDGYGYPQGLKGKEIPLAARVLGVVDSYDAMLSRRPYKDPMPLAAARTELRRCSGTQFDPAVVQALLAVLDTPESGRIIFSTDPDQTMLDGENSNLFKDIPR